MMIVRDFCNNSYDWTKNYLTLLPTWFSWGLVFQNWINNSCVNILLQNILRHCNDLQYINYFHIYKYIHNVHKFTKDKCSDMILKYIYYIMTIFQMKLPLKSLAILFKQFIILIILLVCYLLSAPVWMYLPLALLTTKWIIIYFCSLLLKINIWNIFIFP